MLPAVPGRGGFRRLCLETEVMTLRMILPERVLAISATIQTALGRVILLPLVSRADPITSASRRAIAGRRAPSQRTAGGPLPCTSRQVTRRTGAMLPGTSMASPRMMKVTVMELAGIALVADGSCRVVSATRTQEVTS